MIGIIGAMKVEVQALKEELQNVRTETVSGIDFYIGTLNGVEVVTAVCGIGKVFAAVCAQTMILKFGADKIINVGVAGGVSPTIKRGEIALATSVCQHDMDTSAVGDPIGLISGINQIYLPCDKELVSKIEGCIHKAGLRCETGVIASGDQFVADPVRRDRIVELFNPVAVEMEGASVGQVCTMNKIPFAIIRVISDSASSGAVEDYSSFVQVAAKDALAVIHGIIDSLK